MASAEVEQKVSALIDAIQRRDDKALTDAISGISKMVLTNVERITDALEKIAANTTPGAR